MNAAKYILLLLILTISGQAIAQIKRIDTYYDKDSTLIKESFHISGSNPPVLNGLYISYFHNQNIRNSGKYIHGKASGEWKFHYENGKLKMLGNMEKDLSEGYWQYFFENGNKQMRGFLKNNNKAGEWEYFYENGLNKSKGFYHNGKKEGNWKYFYEDGSFKAEAHYVNDNGEYTEYYRNGNVKMKGVIKDGKSEGEWEYFHEDGELKAKGTEEKGLKVGKWEYYYNDTTIQSKGAFDKGEGEGEWVSYFENGNVASKGTKENGNRTGEWRMFYEDGKSKAKAIFDHSETGSYTEYYDDGRLKTTGNYRNGRHHGPWKYFYKDGSNEGSCNYNNGTGYYKGYYRDGELKMEGTLVDGERSGVWKLFDENGELTAYYKTYGDSDFDTFRQSKADSISNLIRHKELLSGKGKKLIPKKTKLSKLFRPAKRGDYVIIPSLNPFGPVFNQLPISIEYFFGSKFGHELDYAYYKSPFFKDLSKIGNDINYSCGTSVAYNFKIYNPGQWHGMFYFAHELRYSNNIYAYNMPSQTLKYTSNSMAYSVLFGNRYIVNDTEKGFTVDTYIGLGLSYSSWHKNWTDKANDIQFRNLNTQAILIPVRVGLSVGYAF